MAIIRKGDAYALPVIILADGTPITETDVSGVRIGLGTITAIWPDGQLRYDSGVWLLPVTQAQSYTLPQGDVYYQVQVQMSSGETLSSPRTKIHIDSSIFRQPWGKRELDADGSVAASAVTAAVSLQPESIAAEIQNPGVVYGRDAVKYTPQTLTDEQKRQARENIGAAAPYVIPQATADALGGVKADAKTDDDTVPARIDADGKLWVKGQGQANWQENDPSNDAYVKNRPGGYDIVIPAKEITWDGNTEGLDVIPMGDDWGLYRVSLEVLTKKELIGATMTGILDSEFTIKITEGMLITPDEDVISVISDNDNAPVFLICVLHDGTSIYGTTYDAGVYFFKFTSGNLAGARLASLHIDSQTIPQKIPTKFLELPIPTATNESDAGKFLTVGADGNYALTELPKYDGGVS